MNYLSLFSGIGGLDLGLDRAGWTCVGQVEVDPFCRAVLAKHWPEVPRHDDVHTAVEWWRSQDRPAVDAVVGGFPCQPVSVAGKQQAQADSRWLWPATHLVIRQLRPRWAVLENVPGLLGRGMGDVLGDLAASGYDAQWDCLPAAAFGAPHLRYRVFVVAYASGEPGWLQPESKPGSGGTPVVVHYGANGDVADSSGSAWRFSPRTAVATPGALAVPLGSPESRRRGDDLANTAGDRWTAKGQWPPTGHPHWGGQLRRERSAHWQSEPDVGRVADGVPNRLDRLRALGNAVVPQVAEHVGRLILAAINESAAA